MGEFDQYITGTMELTVGGKQLKLDANIKDKRKLKAIFADGKALNESKLEVMDNAFLDILYRSYPNEKQEALLGFYTQNDVEFMEQFLQAVGWASKESVKKAKEESVKLPPN